MAQKNFKNYLLEMLTIVFSITLSFMLNEWRENAQNEAKQVRYLRHFEENLSEDSLKIYQEINDLKSVARASDSIIEYSIGGREVDSLDFFIQTQPVYSTIPINDLAYKELTQTGESGLIKNRNLLKDLISYYDIHFWEIKEYSAIDRKVVLERLLPFYEENLGGADSIQNRSIIRSLRFINLIGYNKNFKSRQIALLQKQLERIGILQSQIRQELRRLD